jgi:hypothetical protein
MVSSLSSTPLSLAGSLIIPYIGLFNPDGIPSTPSPPKRANQMIWYIYTDIVWRKATPPKHDNLSADKRYLMTRGIPYLQREATLVYTDAEKKH